MKHINTLIKIALLYFFLPTSVSGAEGQLVSPLAYQSVSDFVRAVLQAAVYISMPIIAIFIMYAGFKYILARGNPGAIDEAHKNFMFVIIGTMLILGAWVLATLIGGTVTQLANNPA